MRIIETFNELHLGDNLIHLNYLHRLGSENRYIRFIHYCREEYLSQLNELELERYNIFLKRLEDKTPDACNCWIGNNRHFYESPYRYDWVRYHLNFFEEFSLSLGLCTPIHSSRELLFSFPCINKRSSTQHFDVLINNSQPLSGQCYDYNVMFFPDIVLQLQAKGFSVITTNPTGNCASTLEQGYTLLDIAQLSLTCKITMGIPNGPMWMTYNIFGLDNIWLRINYVSIQTLRLTAQCISVDRISTFYSTLKALDVL